MRLLKVPTAEVTPERVFGVEFKRIALAIRNAWKARLKEQEEFRKRGIHMPGQQVSNESVHPLRQISNGGMIAAALADWAEHEKKQRGQNVASPAIIAAWRTAFVWSCDEVKSSGGFRKPNQKKDLGEIVADVAGMALLPQALRRVQAHVEAKPDDRATHLLVQQYLIGSIVSLGTDRVHELAQFTFDHIKEHRNPRTGSTTLRFIRITEADRKAGSTHEIPLIEELVPSWLWTFWKERARLALMEPWRAKHREQSNGHAYLFVTPSGGGPFGGVPEPDKDAAKERERRAATAISSQFTNWRHETLKLGGYQIIRGSYGHHGPHAERARAAKLVLDSGQEEWRTTLLLGHTLNSMVGRAYTASLAATNADTIRTILRQRPWERSDPQETTTSVNGARRSQREQQHAVQRDAELLKEIYALLDGLDEVSPRKAMEELQSLRSRFPRAA